MSEFLVKQLTYDLSSQAGLALIGNTAPVAYGALGTPIVVLSSVTGIDLTS